MPRILLIKLRSLGDSVLLASSIELLKTAYPASEIGVVLTHPWNELYQQDPRVKFSWAFHPKKIKWLQIFQILFLGLKARFLFKPDWVIGFHASDTSALMARIAGGMKRINHYHGEHHRNRFSTLEVPEDKKLKPILEKDFDSLRALGLEGLIQVSIPRLIVKEKLTQSDRETGRILGIGIGASRPTKSWGVESFSEIITKWVKDNSGRVRVFAQENEASEVKEILSRANVGDRVEVFIGSTISQFLEEVNRCSVFLGNDSGPRHVAVALGIPTVTLFGPEDPFEWHPYPTDKNPYFYIEGLDCRPSRGEDRRPWCGIFECHEWKHQCMTQIKPQAVFETCVKLLQK